MAHRAGAEGQRCHGGGGPYRFARTLAAAGDCDLLVRARTKHGVASGHAARGGGAGGGGILRKSGILLTLELALDEWCSCKKLKQSNLDMQYCAQYLSNKLQFQHPGESVVIQ